MPTYFDEFVKHYLICALWASVDEEQNPLDDNYDLDGFSDEAFSQAQDECRSFLNQTGIEHDGCWPAKQAGHDFWLTRNGHGTGFWDRYNDDTYDGKRGRFYTQISNQFGERHIEVGDDGLLYFF